MEKDLADVTNQLRNLGRKHAFTKLGVNAKQVGMLSRLFSTLKAREGQNKILETLVGDPTRIFHPIQMIRETASLKPIREAVETIKHDPSLWNKTKAVGSIGLDATGKAFTLGFPAYGVYRGATTKPQFGETRGETIGRAIGEGLGWLPPMGVLNTAATFLTPEYTLPAATSWLGAKIGKGVSSL